MSLEALVDQFREYRQYSFDDLRREGQPGYPLATDLLPENYVFDTSVLEPDFLDKELVPRAYQFPLIKRWIAMCKDKETELLAPGGGRPFSLKIEDISEKARIEYGQEIKAWTVSIDAEDLYTFLHRRERGIDPDPRPATSTPLRWIEHLRPVQVSIRGSHRFQYYLNLREKVREINTTNNHTFHSLHELNNWNPPWLEHAPDFVRFIEAAEEFTSGSLILDDEFPTKMDFSFRLSSERMKAIEAAMLDIATPCIDTGCQILEVCLARAEEIDWDRVDLSISITGEWVNPDEPQPGGSIRA